MKTVFFRRLSNGQLVEVTDIGQDAQYARACFDGTDRGWNEIMSANPEQFYVVSLGMPGCMSDAVAVYTDRAEAIAGARFWIDQHADESAEEDGAL